MTAAVTLTQKAFFTPLEAVSGFQDLTRLCLVRRGALILAIGAKGVTASLEDAGPQTTGSAIGLGGRWRIEDLAALPIADTGARLVLPLLFRLSWLRLPHDQIYALSRAHRSPAGFFARNLVLALLRGAPLDLEVRDEDAAALKPMREFQNQYVFALKALVPDSAFGGRSATEVTDLVLASGYLPVIRFDNPVLDQGSAAIRRQQLAFGQDQRARLLAARAAMLAQFQP